MLVLTRKADEKIMIGRDVVISILEIEGNSVKIGIDAPRELSILRMEVFEKIQKQNIASVPEANEDIADAINLIKRKFSKESKD